MCGALAHVHFTPDSDPRKRTSAKGHVRFAPESRHVQRSSPCLLRANSGHSDTHSINVLTVHINALSVEYRSAAHAGRNSCGKGKKLTPSRAAISLLEGGILSFKEGQGWRSPDAQERLWISMLKKSSEKIRNAAIMIYMVGNALTFTKLWSMELANLQETGQLGGKMIKALLLSFVWPFYWIGRILFG
jgi:hypothetical protein